MMNKFSRKDKRTLINQFLNSDQIRITNYLNGYRMQIECLVCKDKIHSVFSADNSKCLCGNVTVMENKFHYKVDFKSEMYREKIVQFKKLIRH